MAANMYRSMAGKVHIGSHYVIEDRGKLVSARPGGNGDYIFSERGAGIYPLVLSRCSKVF